MTRNPAPYGRLLLAGALLLAAGIAVLTHGHHEEDTAPAAARDDRPATSTSVEPRTPARTSPAGRPPATAPTTTATHTPVPSPADSVTQPRPSGLPLSGEGPAGDPVVQHILDSSTPADLPAPTARRLVDLAVRIWHAETTGTGREHWPTYFTDPTLRAPYRDVRVQAAIARRDGSRGDRAVVRLVWAGTSPMGTTEDSRPAEVHFQRYGQAWEPIR
ncbi:hypothetical protein ABZV60_29385 [Streptomyces sp. NPDC004787]|uniref:hypothetical protein n=1 Tax=Streptomyces sp. NPDC004787 TaxID=3154291 RepID=UPI00339DE628